MSKQIFICYRRSGAEYLALLLHDYLIKDGYEVFLDTETVRSGKFGSQIYQALSECQDVLVLLPEKSMERCIEPEDWVRKELEYAYEEKKNIIPLYMENFRFPENLPNSLAFLPDLQAITVVASLFEGVMIKIRKMLTSAPQNSRNFHTYSKTYDEILKKWETELRTAKQDLFWNVSQDIHESAAFFADEDGKLYFKNISTGYSLRDIKDVASYIGYAEDESNVRITFLDGDVLTMGSVQYVSTMCLDAKHDGKRICLIEERDIKAFWMVSNDQLKVPRQIIEDDSDAIAAWNYCIFRANLQERKDWLKIQNGYLVFAGENSTYKTQDIREMSYRFWADPEEEENVMRSITVILTDKKIEFYEDGYVEFGMTEYDKQGRILKTKKDISSKK